MTPEGAATAGDDMNSPRSVFSYPPLAYIAGNGEFAHTRPPGMPLHDPNARLPVGVAAQAAAAQAARANTMRVQAPSFPQFEGLEALPADMQEFFRQVQPSTQSVAATATQDGAAAEATPTTTSAPVQATRRTSRDESVLPSVSSYARRIVGNVMRIIPNGSMTTTSNAPSSPGGANTGAAATAHSLVRDLVSQVFGAPLSPTSASAPSNVPARSDTQSDAGNDMSAGAGPSDQTDPRQRILAQNPASSRGRARCEHEDEANDRAAKSSNTGNGMSPAASAAQLSRDTANTSQGTNVENDGMQDA